MEYILLISVISMMFISILRSDQFQDVFGEEANFFKQMRIKLAYEYRHSISREKNKSDTTNNDDENYNVVCEYNSETKKWTPKEKVNAKTPDSVDFVKNLKKKLKN